MLCYLSNTVEEIDQMASHFLVFLVLIGAECPFHYIYTSLCFFLFFLKGWDVQLTRRNGPFAAQSLELPEPYSFPARTSSGTPDRLYLSAASNTSSCKKKRNHHNSQEAKIRDDFLKFDLFSVKKTCNK